MVITFFDYKGMVYTHSVPRGQTINGDYYKQVLATLMNDHISRKRPELRGNWKLHHDIAHVVTEYLAKRNIQVVPHSPYSPDLAPCDFFLFPTAKKELKGRRFDSEQDAVKALKAILKNMSKDGFSNVFQAWQRRWDKCISLNGEYFEGEKFDVDEN
uniref:Tc1-like transposase DDE domain-containing protein n=1 Tax=Graphocephala atropunctata TaxID=36148 RepID=A0A1B6MR58_9HEMI